MNVVFLYIGITVRSVKLRVHDKLIEVCRFKCISTIKHINFSRRNVTLTVVKKSAAEFASVQVFYYDITITGETHTVYGIYLRLMNIF